MTKIRFFGLLLILHLCSSAVAQKNWAVLNDSTIKLAAFGKYSKQSLSFTIDGSLNFKNVEVDPQPLFVRYEGRFDSEYRNAITLSKSLTDEKIQMEINLDSLQAPGIYVGGVRFRYVAEGNESKRLNARFTLLRPAPKLESSEIIRITISGGELESGSPFSILETGGLSDARSVKLISPDIFGVSMPGLIEFTPHVIDIPANSKTQIKYDLSPGAATRLPLGKLTGQMRITAPESPTPLIISWEILNRRNRGLIILLILGGAFVGSVIRNLLVPRKALLESRIKATTQMQRMRAYIDSDVRDAVWSKKFEACVAKLSSALMIRSVTIVAERENVDAAVTSVTNEFNELKTKFCEQVAVTKDNVRKLRDIFEADINISDSSFVSALEAFTKADVNYKNGQLDLAQELCKTSEQELLAFAVEYSRQLREVSNAMSSDSLVPVFIPGRGIFQKWVDDLKSQLPADNVDSIDKIKRFISNAEANKNNLKKFANAMINLVSSMLEGHLKTELLKAHGVWKKTMTSTFLDKDLPDRGKFAVLDQRKTALEKEVGLTSGDNLTTTQAGVQLGMNIALTVEIDSSLVEPRQLPGNGPAITPNIDLLGMVERDKYAFWRINFLQLLLVSFVMALGSYGLYYKDFIGTVPEMISIFVFAFGLDITLDSIKIAAKGGS